MNNFAIDLGNFSVSKLSSSALVVNLSLSVWTGRKLDKRVSEEVDQQNSTKSRAGNYHKNLMAGSGKLTEITKIANAIRSWLYGVTQPGGDNGAGRNLDAERYRPAERGRQAKASHH
jgi:hypothetical protein